MLELLEAVVREELKRGYFAYMAPIWTVGANPHRCVVVGE